METINFWVIRLSVALRDLAAYLPENLMSEALEIARGIQSEYSRAGVFSAVMSRINLEFFDFSFWSEVLHTLSHRGRKELLGDLPNLAPAAMALSDRSTLKLMVQAMKEVSQQWP